MGKLSLIIMSLWVVFTAYGQIKPTSATKPSVSLSLPGVWYDSADRISYVRSYDFYKELTSEGTIENHILNDDVMVTTQYFDGLGRPIQAISRRNLPAHMDLVQFNIYDGLGRETYLPMAFKSDLNDGAFYMAPTNRLHTFMDDHYADEDVFMGKIEFDGSPLNRIEKQMAPGNSWTGNGIGVETEWRNNISTDGVRRWTANASNASSNSIYADNMLIVSITRDEEQNEVREFTDKLGRVILKQVQKGSGTDNGHSNWLNTYYVYDQYSNLRYVVPPRAVELLESAGWVWNTSDMNELVFSYTYDYRNRIITKQVPGASRVDMVYDQLDRLVASRDGNQASSGQWLFTKYDVHNRPVITGFVYTSASRSTMQANADNPTKQNVSKEPLNTQNVLEAHSISLNAHVSGTTVYRARESIEFLTGFDSNGEYFETEIQSDLSSDYTYVQGYYDATFPKLKNYNFEVLSLTYYDDYEFTDKNYSSSYEVGFYTAGIENAIDPNPYSSSKGLATGSRVKVLDSDDWLTTTMYYDDKGRVIQTYSDNHLGGTDVASTQYDFSGKVLNTYTVHSNPKASGADAQTTIAKRFIYDHAGRPLTIQEKLNGASAYKTLVTNTYNDLGELATKTLGNGIESLDYDYNVRGWLEGINKAYANTGTGGNYFGMELSYDIGFTQNQLNGNIAGIKWRSQGNSEIMAYGFDYDQSSELKKADYTQSTAWTQTAVDFSTEYGYDANGNIEDLTRKGLVLGNIQTLDQLVYTYANSNRSNQLIRVSDLTADYGIGDFGDVNTSGDDYAYDANGNMTQDLNKDIQAGGIEYNHLNLPKKGNLWQ